MKNKIYTYIISALLLFPALQLKADKFLVESFTKDEKDLSARKAEVKDINDEMCAIIKVRTSVESIQFKTYPDITKIEYKSNPKEIWLYVSPGIKLITMSGAGFVTQEYVIPNITRVESLNVYIMAVSGVYDYTGINTKDKGHFKVSTEPARAIITMEGNPSFQEYAPYDAEAKQQEWAVGKKKLFFNFDDYYEKDTVFLIEKDKTNEINVKLIPKFSYLVFDVTPKNAEIFIDGVKYSSGKNKILISEIELEIKATHYITYKQKLEVPDGGGTQQIKIELEPVMGKLSVNAGTFVSENADIYVNDKLVGKVPLTSYDIQEGNYSLKISKQGQVTKTQEITIAGNAETKINADLNDLVSVNFQSEPAGAIILIDGKSVGVTPATVPVKLGYHDLKLEKSQYLPYAQSININESTKTQTCKLVHDQLISAKKEYLKYGIIRYSSMALFTGGLLISGYEGYNIYSKYNQYKIATDLATQLHDEIINSRNILFISGGTTILAGVTYLFFNKKYHSSKSRVANLSFLPIDKGVYFTMTLNF